MKTLGRLLAMLLLSVTGVLGLYNGISELNDPITGLQRSVNVAVLLYGALGLLAAVGMARRRAWAVPAAIGWTLASAWAGSVASFAFHDPGFKEAATLAGAITACVGILAVGAFVVWKARSAIRTPATVSEPR
jgi:hypothetical protein